MAVARHRRRLDGDARRLASVGTRLVRPYRSEAESLGKTLRALSPLNVLGRGYAIVTSDAGHVVTDAGALAPGQGISVRLASGRVAATVTGTEKEPESQDGTAEPSSGAAGNDHGKDTDGVGDGATGKEKHGC
jgi:exodeoxyribonuclease VII large subunit